MTVAPAAAPGTRITVSGVDARTCGGSTAKCELLTRQRAGVGMGGGLSFRGFLRGRRLAPRGGSGSDLVEDCDRAAVLRGLLTQLAVLRLQLVDLGLQLVELL